MGTPHHPENSLSKWTVWGGRSNAPSSSRRLQDKALSCLNLSMESQEARKRDAELAVVFKDLAQMVSDIGDWINGRAK